ncbi:hypothetical protein GmHk_18G052073 [Glycine max]|nr:hypothetical protein GmHk_18G052073 [Glycine max]
MASEKPIIRDNISDFSDEDKENDVHESVEPSNQKSHSYLSVWMTVAQHFVPSTIVRYKTTTSMEDESSKVILNCVFWVFKPCIEGFQYCKSIVQYHGTLLNSIGQDGSRNIFPFAFAIFESKSKEA